MARLSGATPWLFHLRAATTSPRKGARSKRGRASNGTSLAEVTRETGVARTAIGHTLDDQAETVLMGLVTGSGIQGTRRRHRPRDRHVGQPAARRHAREIVAFCRSLHLRPRTDPTNADTRFLRNAVRLRGHPGLERAVGRSLSEPLVRTAAGLREDADELMRQTFEVLDDVIDETPEGVDLLATRLLDLPRAIAGRVVANAVY